MKTSISSAPQTIACREMQPESVASVGDGLSALTAVEERDFDRCEKVISNELTALMKVGLALLEIKERKLYRAKFHTFEAYCQARWGWKKSQAYRMVDAAEVCAEISPNGGPFSPEHERQVRPLRGLPPAKAKEAWRRALENAKGERVTGADVKRAVGEISEGPSTQLQEEKLSWQINIEPLLKKAAKMLKTGDRDEFELLIEKISCLLLVGKRPISCSTASQVI